MLTLTFVKHHKNLILLDKLGKFSTPTAAILTNGCLRAYATGREKSVKRQEGSKPAEQHGIRFQRRPTGRQTQMRPTNWLRFLCARAVYTDLPTTYYLSSGNHFR